MALLATGLILLLSGSPPSQCASPAQTQAHLHWSEPAEVVSPNRLWRVEVHPVLTAEDNETPVILRACQTGDSHSLFILERDADVYWSPDSKHLLVINQPISGTNKLLLFAVHPLSKGYSSGAADRLDKLVWESLLPRLGAGKVIQFYLRQFVSWHGQKIVLALGGAATFGNTGPMTSYCYGINVSTNPLRVEDVFSRGELKTKFGAVCAVFP